jgi:hypothetical protein
MEDRTGLLTETEWGLLIELKEGFTFDDKNFETAAKVLVESCKIFNKKKVLIDATKSIPGASVMKMLDIANLFSKSDLRIKMAIIPPAVYDENTRTMETFSFNRGVYIHYFQNKDTALAWLQA